MNLAPHPFTLRQLQYAVAVADTLSFHRAAARCHVSQPSLSAQLAQLEGALVERLVSLGLEQLEALAFLDREELRLGRILQTSLRRPDRVTVAVPGVDAPVTESDAATPEWQMLDAQRPGE